MSEETLPPPSSVTCSRTVGSAAYCGHRITATSCTSISLAASSPLSLRTASSAPSVPLNRHAVVAIDTTSSRWMALQTTSRLARPITGWPDQLWVPFNYPRLARRITLERVIPLRKRAGPARSAKAAFTGEGHRRLRRTSRLLQELPRHDHALDLVGALVDLGDLRVAHHALDREVVHVAVAAEQLYRVGGHRHGHVGGQALARRGEERQVIDPLSGHGPLGPGRRRVGELAGRLELHRHVGDHELQALEFRDRPAELLALPDVPERVVQGALGDAEGLRGDRDASVVQGAQRDLEAFPFLADQPGGRDRAVVEVQLPGRRALDAELVLRFPE